MSDSEQDKPNEESTENTEGTSSSTDAVVKSKVNEDESVTKAATESDGSEPDKEETAQTSTKSGIEDGSKSKGPSTKSGIEDSSKIKASSTKSGIEDGPKSKQGTKSGIDDSKKNKSQAQDGKSKPKSSIDDGAKSGTKSEVKQAKSGCDRRSSSAGSSGRKPSRTASGSRSRAADLQEARIGFVGAGRMADSIVKGLLRGGKIKAKQLFVAAKTTKNLDAFKLLGVTTSTRSYDVFGKFDCDLVFLCVHGNVVRNCFKLGGTRPAPFTTNYIPSRKRPIFVLSLIGGVPLEDVKITLLNPESESKYKVELHRLVLNTSVAYGLGLGVLDVELDSKKCHPLVRDTLQAIAKIELSSPDVMDATCTVLGSGLALTHYFISSLADGGFKMGLNRPMATKLATKALQCAAQCILETSKSPLELRDTVTSPCGAAIYGLNVLDKQDCSSGIQAAIEASYKRLKELVEVNH